MCFRVLRSHHGGALFYSGYFMGIDEDNPNTHFVYRPPEYDCENVISSTVGYKFSQAVRILDPWWIIGGTKWTRFLFRLKHPIVYSKRGLRGLYRRVRRLFISDIMTPCLNMRIPDEH